MPKRSLGLFWSVFLAVMLGFAAVLAGFAFLANEAAREGTERTLQARLDLAEVTAGRLDDLLNRTIHVVELTIESSNLDLERTPQADQEHFVQSLRSYLNGFAYYTLLIRSDYRVAAAAPVIDEVIDNDWSNAWCVNRVLATGESLITPSFTLGTPTPTVAMVVPVRDDSGRVTGVVFTALNLNHSTFTDLVHEANLGETGYMEIVDSSGVVLGATRPNLRWRSDDHRSEFANLIRDGQSSVGMCHDCHEGPDARHANVMAFAPLSISPWGVALRQEPSEVFTYSEGLQRRTIAFSGAAFVLCAVVAAVGTRRLVRPIQMLTDTCLGIAKGDLDAPIPSGGIGEVGVLASAFNVMRGRLRTSLEEIQSGKAELEERVAQRTQEVVESQRQLVKANAELFMLNAVGDALRQSVDLRSSLDRALDKVIELTGALGGFVCLLDEKTDSCHAVTSRQLDNTDPALVKNPAVPETVRETIKQARVHTLEIPGQIDGEPDNGHAPQAPRTLISVPLTSTDRTLGAMTLLYSQPHPFTAAETDLLISVGTQIGMSAENALLFAALQEKEEARSLLLRKVIGAQEDERRRIARELHDETSQALTALRVGLEAAIMAPADGAASVKQRLIPMKTIATGLLGEIHRMIKDLRPSLLDDLGLISAIDWYAESRLKEQGIHVDWEVNGAEQRLPTEIETTVFRMAQEAISNVARHARAENVSVSLDFAPHALTLHIEDDGVGFDPASVLGDNTSGGAYGLVGMRERVEMIGGELSVDSVPGQGTRVQAVIPVTSYIGLANGEDSGSAGR